MAADTFVSDNFNGRKAAIRPPFFLSGKIFDSEFPAWGSWCSHRKKQGIVAINLSCLTAVRISSCEGLLPITNLPLPVIGLDGSQSHLKVSHRVFGHALNMRPESLVFQPRFSATIEPTTENLVLS
jgi:hypothetical protein